MFSLYAISTAFGFVCGCLFCCVLDTLTGGGEAENGELPGKRGGDD